VLRTLVQTKSAEAALSAAVRRTLRQGLNLATLTATVFSVAWIASALFFRRTSTAQAALGAVLRQALPRGDSHDVGEVRARSAATAATCFSLLGAGGSLVLALLIKRCWLPKVALPPTRGEVRAVVPCISPRVVNAAAAAAVLGGRSQAAASPSVPAARLEPETEVSPDCSESEVCRSRQASNFSESWLAPSGAESTKESRSRSASDV